MHAAGVFFESACPNCRIIFGETFSRVETRVYYHRISDYSNDILALLTRRRPGQVPGWRRNLVRSCSEANKSDLAQKFRQIYGIRHFIISFLRPVTVAIPSQICLVHKVPFCCFNFHVILSSSLYPTCFGRSPFRLFVCPIQIIPVSAAVAVLVYALSELLTSDYLYCAGTHCPYHYVILKEETRLVLSFVSFNAQIWDGEVKPLGRPALIDTQIEIFTWVLLGLVLTPFQLELVINFSINLVLLKFFTWTNLHDQVWSIVFMILYYHVAVPCMLHLQEVLCLNSSLKYPCSKATSFFKGFPPFLQKNLGT